MKKNLFIIGLFSVLCATVFAQDFDAQIQAAVDELAVTLKVPVELVINPITVAESDTPSALSKFLYDRIEYSAVKNTSKYRVVAKIRGTRQARIEGTYEQRGDTVEVSLSLISDTGTIIGKSLLKLPTADLKKLGIAWLPENRKTEEEAVQQDKAITEAVQLAIPLPPKAIGTAVAAFTLDAWPDSDSYTYFDGDKMRISLYASKDCYFKVYYVDVENQRTLIYPNQFSNNNYLQANKVRTIPDGIEKFDMKAPFGVESILVVASDRPLEYSNAEMEEPVAASRGIEVKAAGNTGAGAIVETKFSYTILPKKNIDEVLSYQKPDNMSDFVQQFRSIVQKESGTVNGNEREGTFTTGHLSGGYKVSGNSLVFTFRHPVEESLSRGSSSATRGIGGAYNFSFSKPANLPQAVQKVRSEIEKSKGVFRGDENAGSFKASGIEGNYIIGNDVRVTITDKPFVVPTSLIEKEVKNYFGVK